MTLDGEPEESDGFDLESVDRFLDFQRRLLDDGLEPEDDLTALGGATLEDEPDELDP
jgi:hypothetical protein